MNNANICGYLFEPEKEIQAQWNRLRRGTVLRGIQGEAITLINPGVFNSEAGPDFKNAKIVLDGNERKGDVEIHQSANDWFQHRHDADTRYRNVILHVVRTLSARTPDIPTLQLSEEHYDENLIPEILPGECADKLAEISEETLRETLLDAGLERLKLKAERICQLILQEGIETTALRSLFDAAGYKNNRQPFGELCSRWLAYPSEIRNLHAETILWGESGLLPDPAITESIHPELRETVDCFESDFWKLRPKAETPIQWNRCGCRPFNSPERRLAGLIFYLQKCECHPAQHWLSLLSRSTADLVLEHLLCELKCSDPVWNSFRNFKHKMTKPAVVQGEGRVTDLIGNVILPFMMAYGWLFGDSKLPKLAVEIFQILPSGASNHLLETAVLRCFGRQQRHRAQRLLRMVATQQGLLHLYLNFCEINQSDCATCRMIHPDSPKENT